MVEEGVSDMMEEHGVDRLTLVELIEAEKGKMSDEGRDLWETFDASLYLSPEEETRLKRHEVAMIKRMADLPTDDQHAINIVTELRAGLYNSDFVERRGEPGEAYRNKCVITAAAIKDRDKGRRIGLDMTLGQALHRLREAG